jgi:type I restriction enzyme, S subunit
VTISRTPSTWARVKLGTVAENLDARRVPLKQADRAQRDGPYPYYGASGIIDSIDDYIYEGEHLLVAEDGANLLARATPIAFRATGRFWVNNHAHILSFNGKADLRFLERYLSTVDLKPYVTGSAQPKLNRTNLDRIEVPLPSLSEQKRIAGILDAADALRAKRREALAQLDTLLQSTFLDMFGDPVERPGVTEVPDGWSYETIADIASDEKYSCVGGPFGSDLTSKDYVDEPGVPVIRGGDLATDNVNMREDQFVFVTNEKAASLSRNMAFRGDVVVSQRGARLAGQVALIPENSAYERYVVSQSQMKVTLNPERVLATYLITYMRSPKGTREMESRTISTGVPHINLGILKKFPVPVPPLELQQEFTRVVDSVEQQKAQMVAHLTKLDSLFASLQSRAFNGEL